MVVKKVWKLQAGNHNCAQTVGLEALGGGGGWCRNPPGEDNGSTKDRSPCPPSPAALLPAAGVADAREERERDKKNRETRWDPHGYRGNSVGLSNSVAPP